MLEGGCEFSNQPWKKIWSFSNCSWLLIHTALICSAHCNKIPWAVLLRQQKSLSESWRLKAWGQSADRTGSQWKPSPWLAVFPVSLCPRTELQSHPLLILIVVTLFLIRISWWEFQHHYPSKVKPHLLINHTGCQDFNTWTLRKQTFIP